MSKRCLLAAALILMSVAVWAQNDSPDKSERKTQPGDRIEQIPTGKTRAQSAPEGTVHEIHEPIPEKHPGRLARVGKTLRVPAGQSVQSAIVLAGEVVLDGEVLGDLKVIGGSVRFGENAVVKGDLVLWMSDAEMQRPQVKGEVREIQAGQTMVGLLSLLTGPPRRESEAGAVLIYALTGYRLSWGNIWLFWEAAMFLLVLLAQLVLVAVLPLNLENMSAGLRFRPIGSLLIGIGLSLFLVPIYGVLLLSPASIPVVLLSFSLVMLLAVYGKTAILVSLGNTILQRPQPNGPAVVLGYVIYRLATALPAIGLFFFLFINLLAIGISLRTGLGSNPVQARKQQKRSDYEVRSGWDSPVRGS